MYPLVSTCIYLAPLPLIAQPRRPIRQEHRRHKLKQKKKSRHNKKEKMENKASRLPRAALADAGLPKAPNKTLDIVEPRRSQRLLAAENPKKVRGKKKKKKQDRKQPFI